MYRTDSAHIISWITLSCPDLNIQLRLISTKNGPNEDILIAAVCTTQPSHAWRCRLLHWDRLVWSTLIFSGDQVSTRWSTVCDTVNNFRTPDSGQQTSINPSIKQRLLLLKFHNKLLFADYATEISIFYRLSSKIWEGIILMIRNSNSLAGHRATLLSWWQKFYFHSLGKFFHIVFIKNLNFSRTSNLW